MHVSICIVAFHNPGDIVECLAALEGLDHRDFEVVVCENGDAAAYQALRQVAPSELAGGQTVQLVHDPTNPGYAGGVNRCIAASRDADAWWVLNPDARPEPGALTALLDRLRMGDVDAVGGCLYYPSGLIQAAGGRWRPRLARVESLGRDRPVDQPIERHAIESRMTFIHGAAMLVSARFVDVAGPMREDYFLYCEEVEWCVRAIKAGLRLGFAPGARILHAQGSTTGSADDIRKRPRLPIYMDERNKLLLVRDSSRADILTALPAAILLLVLRYAPKGAWAQLRYGLQGILAALRNERGKPRSMGRAA